jgi:hypothetical protein
VYKRQLNDTLIASVWHFGIPEPDLGSGMDSLEVDLPHLLDGGVGYPTYLWNGTSGGQTFEAGSYGWVFLEVISEEGCAGTDSVFLMDFTGMSAHALPGQLKVYPVPASRFLNVEYEGDEQDELFLELFDPSGRKMLTRQYHSVRTLSEKLDVSGWKDGIYYLRIRSGQLNEVRAVPVSAR